LRHQRRLRLGPFHVRVQALRLALRLAGLRPWSDADASAVSAPTVAGDPSQSRPRPPRGVDSFAQLGRPHGHRPARAMACG
jgi:hypothetical protein